MTTPEDRPDLLRRRLARERLKLLRENYCPACDVDVGEEPHACRCPDCGELVQDDRLPHRCKLERQRWWSRPGALPPLYSDDPRAEGRDTEHPTKGLPQALHPPPREPRLHKMHWRR